MENVIHDVERINEIQAIEEYLKTIETDVEQVHEKCRKIDCLIIREAVDAFFADKPEFIIPVPDKSGTCVVRKV